jgi:MFS family permease
MSEEQKVTKFAGIEVAPDLNKANFFFLYLNTLMMGMLMVMPAVIQPAFLQDVIQVSPKYFGFINGFLQNMSQIATLAFVGIVGALSDKTGRKILAIVGFIIMGILYYMFGQSVAIAEALNISPEFAAKVCAILNFAPSKSAEFVSFAPGLFMAYILRLLLGIGMIMVYPQFITMCADYTDKKDRGKAMALNGMMMGLASIIIFAAVAPLGAKTGISGLFIFAAIMAAFGTVSTLVFLKERMPEIKQEEKKSFKEVRDTVMGSASIKASCLCSLISRADIGVMATFIIAWAVLQADVLGISSVEATKKGAIPMIIMSMGTFVAFPIIGILLDKWGRLPTMILTLLCGGVGFMMIAFSPSPFSGTVYFAVILIAFCISGSIAGANTMATDVSPKAMVGAVLGWLNTAQPIGMLIFLQVGGYLFDVLGPGWAFGLKGGADILLALWLIIVSKKVNAELDAIKKTDAEN